MQIVFMHTFATAHHLLVEAIYAILAILSFPLFRKKTFLETSLTLIA